MANSVQLVSKLISSQLYALSRRQGLLSLATLAYVLVIPALAHAHGSMSSDELGPPLVTSGLLGFVSYWVVMLWPSSHKDDTAQAGSNQQNKDAPRPRRNRSAKTGRMKRTPHLRMVELGGQVHNDQQSRRKASDG
jgi:hypothetical protein